MTEQETIYCIAMYMILLHNVRVASFFVFCFVLFCFLFVCFLFVYLFVFFDSRNLELSLCSRKGQNKHFTANT